MSLHAVGPFQPLALLGRGGMGEVWRALHPSGLTVALKVLSGENAQRGSFRAAFDAEVRNHASLAHPRIVGVLDAGLADVPWLALELMPRGTLFERRRSLGSPELLRVLSDVLDALAHAHARGVLHLDIKPSNVLFAADDTPRLADFGIGRRVGEPGRQSGGTPRYMAPEQFRGDWRALGPWTDLYALGVLTWMLATGAPPYAGDFTTLEEAHAAGALPPFTPRLVLPAGFEGWLRGLLEPEPELRVRHAADARRALSEVCGGRPGRQLDAEELIDPPIFAGMGLGLHGLRALPLSGRRAERERLVAAFDGAEQGVATVLIDGPAGIGKSRLARWLTERAAELGAAEVLEVTPRSGGRGGPGEAIARHTRLISVPWDARVAALIADGLTPDEAIRLAAVIAEDAGPDYAYPGRLEREAAIGRLLVRMSAERPLILWLDDAAGDPELLALAERLVGQRGPLRCLLVLTGADEAVAASPRWAALAARPGVTRLTLDGLAPDEARRMVRELLGLGSDATARIAAAAGGSPLIAAELVRDLVDRGQLVASTSGYRLLPGARIEAPEGLTGLWRSRVESALRGRSADERAAVERAATLGLEFDPEEWRAASSPASPALLDHMARAGLVRGAPPRVTFAHPLLRAALLEQARGAGRLEAHHAACAAALDGRGALLRRGRHLVGSGRLREGAEAMLGAVLELFSRGDFSTCLVVLGEIETALLAHRVPAADPLYRVLFLRRGRALMRLGRPAEASALIEALDPVALGWPIGEIEALRGELLLDLGALDAAIPVLEAAVTQLTAEDPSLVATLVTLAFVRSRLGDHEGAIAAALSALSRVAQLPGLSTTLMSGVRHADAWYALAFARFGQQDYAGAETALEQAVELYARLRVTIGLGQTYNLLGSIAEAQGRYAAAVRSWSRAAQLYEQCGSRFAVVPRFNLIYRLIRSEQIDEAERELARLRFGLDELRELSRIGAGLCVLRAWVAALRGDRASCEAAVALAEQATGQDRELVETIRSAAEVIPWPELRERVEALACRFDA